MYGTKTDPGWARLLRKRSLSGGRLRRLSQDFLPIALSLKTAAGNREAGKSA
jgi:hypothetical protein